MKYSLLIVFFGITSFLLKPSVYAAEASFYKFPAGACYKLKNSDWSEAYGRCEQEERSFELSGALNSFCLYELKSNESLPLIAKKLGFLRPLKTTRLSLTNTGVIMTSSFIRTGAKLLFYKGDILKAKDKNLCRKPAKVDMYSSFYALSYPATFYVMRPFLKKVNDKSLKEKEVKPLLSNIENEEQINEEKDPFKNLRDVINSPSDFEASFTKDNRLVLSPSIFFESFNGTQISNGSKAEIVNDLSVAVFADYIYDYSDRFNFSIGLGAELHRFGDRVGQLRIDNENLTNFSLSTKQIFKINSRLNVYSHLGLYEDIFYQRISSGLFEMKKDLIPRLGLGFKASLIRYRNFDLGLSPLLFYDLAGSEFESGMGFNVPFFVSFRNDSFIFDINLGYNNREKNLDDLKLDYSRYYLELNLGFSI